MLAKTFMIGFRGQRGDLILKVSADNLFFWHKHDLVEGCLKIFDFALTQDLLMIQKFFGLF